MAQHATITLGVGKRRCRPVRDVLMRYLDERRAGLDYGSLHSLVGLLVGNFWADIERRHPEVDSLRLPEEVAEAWKQRLRVVQRKDGATQPRKSYLTVLMKVRTFSSTWTFMNGRWKIPHMPVGGPSPVRRGDTVGLA
jgi:hypothetical protein